MILDRILKVKRLEVQARKAAAPQKEIERLAATAPPACDFAGALARAQDAPIRLVAEFKRASPSKGDIRTDLAPADVAGRYERAGAAAMSVLTDEPFFSGTLDDLRAVRAAVQIPLLRKDFILDAYQLYEARAAGADAVLLIAAALSAADMSALHQQAAEVGLAALVEVHSAEELDRALAIGPRIIGINNRDLKTFDVNLETTCRLRARVPPGIVLVSESGIRTRDDVVRLESEGVDAVLVGETLMRHADPGAAAAELLGGA